MDEKPPDMAGDNEFGSYAATWTAGDGELVFTRALEVRSELVPPENYEDVRRFFNIIVNAEQSPVVLVRQ